MKKVIAVGLMLVLLFTLAACTQTSLTDEIKMMQGVLLYFDDPQLFHVSVLERYEVSEEEIYYYMEWAYHDNGDTNTYEFLVIYNTQTELVQLAHFQDMEAGYKANVKEVWDRLKTEEPDRTFTQAELEEVIDEAAECNAAIDEASD